ncbi:MAG TPA: Rrf2 family transcriptional regulator [Deltaproteobacteria bacterium]|nr:Rrf2 family transcriptional regulator [Deltaproteobacteria bacterium]
MKLSAKSEYALLALIFLARNDSEKLIPVHVIATAQSIPVKFLEQILAVLKRARYLRSQRGQEGGYALAKPPEQIQLAEIIRLFDGALAPTESVSVYFYEPTPIEKELSLIAVFRDIRDYIAKKLENTTLADIAHIGSRGGK